MERHTNILVLVLFAFLLTACCRTPSFLSPQITQMERHMNILVLVLFAFLLIASCFLAMGDQLWQRSHQQGAWYLQFNGEWPDLGVGFSGWVIQVLLMLGL